MQNIALGDRNERGGAAAEFGVAPEGDAGLYGINPFNRLGQLRLLRHSLALTQTAASGVASTAANPLTKHRIPSKPTDKSICYVTSGAAVFTRWLPKNWHPKAKTGHRYAHEIILMVNSGANVLA